MLAPTYATRIRLLGCPPFGLQLCVEVISKKGNTGCVSQRRKRHKTSALVRPQPLNRFFLALAMSEYHQSRHPNYLVPFRFQDLTKSAYVYRFLHQNLLGSVDILISEGQAPSSDPSMNFEIWFLTPIYIIFSFHAMLSTILSDYPTHMPLFYRYGHPLHHYELKQWSRNGRFSWWLFPIKRKMVCFSGLLSHNLFPVFS